MMTFTQKIIALIKGDNESIKAEKIERRAKSLINLQISATENEILKAKDSIEQQENDLSDAIANYGSTEFNDSEYVKRILDKKAALVESNSTLENLETTLNYLKEVSEYICQK